MPSRFRVVAIVAAYNESDIIAQVVADLIAQGTDVYFLDDGSSDGTVAAVEPFVGHGVLAIEPLRVANRPASVERFDWEIILRRKADVARSIDADWFIHHDADELRESPWRGVTLSDAVQRVDAADFNAIDFASLDFWPVHDGFQTGDDLRTAFTHYSRRAPYDAVQIRAWKNTGADVDLVSSGGHDIQFPGRRVFPIRFLSRHYPIRSQAHGERKVFRERLGRFLPHERARGWHVQYDALPADASFVRDPGTLTLYDPDAVQLSLVLHHRGVETLEEELQNAQRALAVSTATLDKTSAELASFEGELRRVSGYVRSLEAELARVMAGIAAGEAARQTALADAAVRLAAAESESAARARTIDAASAFVARQSQAIAALQAAVRACARDVAAIRQSLSWRLTAPARAVVRAFTRR